MDSVELGIKVDATGVDAASKAFDRLAESIERATAALKELEGVSHGGIVIKAVGEVVICTVNTPDESAADVREKIAEVERSISRGARTSDRRFKL